MKTLNIYLTKNMLATCGMSLGILMFVMLSGNFVKTFEFMSRGVSPLVMLRFLAYLMPEMLRFALPLAVLVSTVLVFSRLSADNEIVAMKAIGISIWQIISPALVLSILCCIICFVNSLFLAPMFRYESERLRWEAVSKTPLALLEPGFFTDIVPQCSIRIGSRKEDELFDIHIILRDNTSPKYQDIVAKRGTIITSSADETLSLVLQEVNITDYRLDQEPSAKNIHFLAASSITLPLDFGQTEKRRAIKRKMKYMDFRMLFAKMALDKEAGLDITEHLASLHNRLALAFAPFSFLLLGLSFGIRSKRSELSIGLLICVLLALGYYAFIVLSSSLENHANVYPQYIIWIPNILYQTIGLLMIHKMDRNC